MPKSSHGNGPRRCRRQAHSQAAHIFFGLASSKLFDGMHRLDGGAGRSCLSTGSNNRDRRTAVAPIQSGGDVMRNKLGMLLATSALFVGPAAAQDAASLLQAADRAIGASAVNSIVY